MAIWDDGVLNIARSWTGICMIRLILGEGDVHELQVNPAILEDDANKLQDLVMTVTDMIVDNIIGPVRLPVNMIPSGVVGNVVPGPPEYRWMSGDEDGEFIFRRVDADG